MTPLDWALQYAAAGWRVYPVVPGTKQAMFKGWLASATTDPELIARQWRREPYPSIGLVCGEGFAVFDIEAPHLAVVHAYLDRIGQVLPELPASGTGRGGMHLYVQPIADITTTRRLFLDGRHIGEFKTTGGVIAPPSVTEQQYRWYWLPDEFALPAAPSWLKALIGVSGHGSTVGPAEATWHRPGDPVAALDALARAVRDAPVGNRNNRLFWAACCAVEDGIPAAIAGTVLRRVAMKAGLERPEIDATIDSAFAHLGVLR